LFVLVIWISKVSYQLLAPIVAFRVYAKCLAVAYSSIPAFLQPARFQNCLCGVNQLGEWQLSVITPGLRLVVCAT